MEDHYDLNTSLPELTTIYKGSFRAKSGNQKYSPDYSTDSGIIIPFEYKMYR
jgi:hypothetical protein